jgi:hypothetical protein
MTTPGSVHRDFRTRICAIAFATALVSGGVVAPVRADSITDDNVVEAVSAAKTPADHQALAAYFTAKAEAAGAQGERHTRMAAAFSGKGHENMQMHCKALARTSKEQAKDYTALAKEQDKLAGGK